MKKGLAFLVMAAVTLLAALAVGETALPAYVSTCEDPIEAAVANAVAEDGANYLTEPGSVSIPCPVILRTDLADDTHAKVYGNFWVMNYVLEGDVLSCISGGEAPGIMTLEKDGDAWRVVSREEAGDGEAYGNDLERFAAGDEDLLAGYLAAGDMGAEPAKNVRTLYIREYVEANRLPVTAYQDPYWDPVPLEDGAGSSDPLPGEEGAPEARDAAWLIPETTEMTEEASAVFTKAMETLMGVTYEPVGLLAEKEGTYCILCRATVVYPGAVPYYALVYVNREGVLNIWDLWIDAHAE